MTFSLFTSCSGTARQNKSTSAYTAEIQFWLWALAAERMLNISHSVKISGLFSCLQHAKQTQIWIVCEIVKNNICYFAWFGLCLDCLSVLIWMQVTFYLFYSIYAIVYCSFLIATSKTRYTNKSRNLNQNETIFIQLIICKYGAFIYFSNLKKCPKI